MSTCSQSTINCRTGRFFLDFGPLNLGCLYRFSELLKAKLGDKALTGKRIYLFSSTHMHKRANAVYLLAAFSLLFLGKSPEEAFRPFHGVSPPLAPWHDASPTVDTFHLSTLDVLRGIAKARDNNFFSFDAFDIDEYEHYERVENGDMNWIVEGRFLAFAGPHDVRASTAEGYHTTAVDDVVPYFRAKGVTTVVRLNKKYYNEKRFTHAGIAHHDMYYLDGSNPPDHILQRFLAIVESTAGSIAVHCKAGLGRTGTCIGAYLMKHYRFSAREVIGWMRVCRPGSVIGPQQQFMEEIQPRMWADGDAFRRVKDLPPPVVGTLLYLAQCAPRQAAPAVKSTGTVSRSNDRHSPTEMMSSLALGGGSGSDTSSTFNSAGGGRLQTASPAESSGISAFGAEAPAVGSGSPPSRSTASGSSAWGVPPGRSTTRSVITSSTSSGPFDVSDAVNSGGSITPPAGGRATPTTPSAASGRRSGMAVSAGTASAPYASPGSSPAAQSYLVRPKHVDAPEASGAPVASGSRGSSSTQSVSPLPATAAPRFGSVSVPASVPSVVGSQRPGASTSAVSSGGTTSPSASAVSMGSQGDLLRSAKNRSPQVGILGSPALGLRQAGTGVVTPPVRSPGFSFPGEAPPSSGKAVSPSGASPAPVSSAAASSSSRFSLRGR